MSAPTQLNALETLIIQSMRRQLEATQGAWLSTKSKVDFDDIDTQLRRFIDLLRETDPFVVKLRPLFDPKTTLFELQLLYAISEKRCGNEKTVSEVLNWWFPPAGVSEAHHILGRIAAVLNEADLKVHTTQQIKEQMLVASVARPEDPAPSVSVNRDLHPISKYLNTETLH